MRFHDGLIFIYIHTYIYNILLICVQNHLKRVFIYYKIKWFRGEKANFKI